MPGTQPNPQLENGNFEQTGGVELQELPDDSKKSTSVPTEKRESGAVLRISLIRQIWVITGFQKKTLWDWLSLLIVPAALALGALVIQKHFDDKQREYTIEHDRQELLKNYISQMTELLLTKGLIKREIEEEAKINNKPLNAVEEVNLDEMQVVAKAMTLTALRELDEKRKNQLVHFLYEAKLIKLHKEKCILSSKSLCSKGIISLRQADLSEINLSKADLNQADFRGAYLNKANLNNSHLNGGDFSYSYLRKADLKNTDLRNVDFKGANLQESKMEGANLQGAYYDQNTIFPINFDPVSVGMRKE